MLAGCSLTCGCLGGLIKLVHYSVCYYVVDNVFINKSMIMCTLTRDCIECLAMNVLSNTCMHGVSISDRLSAHKGFQRRPNC